MNGPSWRQCTAYLCLQPYCTTAAGLRHRTPATVAAAPGGIVLSQRQRSEFGAILADFIVRKPPSVSSEVPTVMPGAGAAAALLCCCCTETRW